MTGARNHPTKGFFVTSRTATRLIRGARRSETSDARGAEKVVETVDSLYRGCRIERLAERAHADIDQ